MAIGRSSRPGTGEATPAAWLLSSILTDLCFRSGVPANSFVSVYVDAFVEGYYTTSKYSALSAIQSLSAVFMFDPANVNGQLSFVPRGGPVVANITKDDLIEDGDETESVNRSDSISVPKVVNLKYHDIDGGLNLDMQTSDRSLDSRASSTSTTETTVIMTAGDAAKAVAISHKVSIEEQRGEFTIKLPPEYLYLTESDVITFEGQRCRITDKEINDGYQSYKVSFDRASAYESEIEGLPIVPPSPPPSLIADESVFEFIDIPILDSEDDQLGYYGAVSSLGNNWSGAVVELSRNGGQTWIDSTDSNSNHIVGRILTTVPAHNRHYPDERNVITVQLLRTDMELEHATLEEMMNRFNTAVIGNELINFGEAEQIAPDTWELSYLLRGRKGTPITSHAVGERFVYLPTNAVDFIEAELFDLNKPLTFRAISYSLETAPSQTYTFTGRSQRERAPAYLRAKRNGANVIISWQGVGRLGGGTSVRMGQYFNGFLVRYNGTQQITRDEFIEVPYSAGTVSVCQLNTLTGEGPQTTIEI